MQIVVVQAARANEILNIVQFVVIHRLGVSIT